MGFPQPDPNGPYASFSGGHGQPPAYYNPQTGGPNLLLGTAKPAGINEPTAYSNIAFGGGYRPGVPTTGNLGSVTDGFDNVAIGAGVLVSVTTGHSNVGIGADAASSLTTGSSIVAIGAQAAESLVTATDVTAIGGGALQNATAGPNTAVGKSALNALTTGTQNVAVGGHSGETLTTATTCTAIGYASLQKPTGADNTAVGANALQGAAGGSTASESVAVGYNSLHAVTSGLQNAAVGSQTLTAVTTGGNNTAVGAFSGLGTLTTGSGNTFLGYNSGRTDGTTATTNNNNMTLIGAQAQSQIGDVIVLGRAIATRPNLYFGLAPTADQTGGAVGAFFMANSVSAPKSANPVGGGYFYVTAGALHWVGSAGTDTTVAVA